MRRAYYNEFDPFAAAWLRELIKVKMIAEGDVDERSIVRAARLGLMLTLWHRRCKMKMLRHIFLDPCDGGLRGRWYLLTAAIIWIGGNWYIFHYVIPRSH